MEEKRNIYIPKSKNESLKFEIDRFADGSRATPILSINNNWKYVEWRDTSSIIDYPNQLLRLYNNSVLHAAIINLKASQIIGGGLIPTDEKHPKYTETLNFIETINKDGDDLNVVLEKVVLDYVLFNFINTQINFDKVWNKIISVDHLESNKIRVEVPDENGKINGAYWKFDWGKYKRGDMIYLPKFNNISFSEKKNNIKEVENSLFEKNDEDELKKYQELLDGERYAIHSFKKYFPDQFYYPVPEYAPAVTAIESDIESSVYCYNALKTGMDDGKIISMYGSVGDKECDEAATAFYKNYFDKRAQGVPVMMFYRSKDDKPDIDSLGSDNVAQKYQEINKEIQSKILMSHQIPSGSMIGIQTAGKLGNTTDSQTHEEIFFNRYVKPCQKIIVNYFNQIMKYNELCEIKIINNNVFNESKIESEKAGIDTDEESENVEEKNNII